MPMWVLYIFAFLLTFVVVRLVGVLFLKGAHSVGLAGVDRMLGAALGRGARGAGGPGGRRDRPPAGLFAGRGLAGRGAPGRCWTSMIEAAQPWLPAVQEGVVRSDAACVVAHLTGTGLKSCVEFSASSRETPSTRSLYDGLLLLQHRGQDAAGIATCTAAPFSMQKGNGLVRDVFRTRNMRALPGSSGIAHVRYPTAGSASNDEEAQPFYVNAPFGLTLAHNGNLTNSAELKDEMFRLDRRHINTDSDSEVLLNVLANELQANASGISLDPGHDLQGGVGAAAAGSRRLRLRGRDRRLWRARLSRSVRHPPDLLRRRARPKRAPNT